jgi:uncharacterized membrane protein
MSLTLLLVLGAVVACLAVVAIAVAIVFSVRRSRAEEHPQGMDTIWIVVGLVVISVVCCLAAGGVVLAGVFFFGVQPMP